MMPIEKQVCSLGLAKRLKEAGARQKSLFYWERNHSKDEQKLFPSRLVRHNQNVNFAYFAAFTCAELGEMLPKGILTQKAHTGFICHRDYMDAMCESTEANARAKMLCHLLENGLMGKERG